MNVRSSISRNVQAVSSHSCLPAQCPNQEHIWQGLGRQARQAQRSTIPSFMSSIYAKLPLILLDYLSLITLLDETDISTTSRGAKSRLTRPYLLLLHIHLISLERAFSHDRQWIPRTTGTAGATVESVVAPVSIKRYDVIIPTSLARSSLTHLPLFPVALVSRYLGFMVMLAHL